MIAVLSITDQLGRQLTTYRVDLDKLKGGHVALTPAYLLPCEIGVTIDEGFGFNIELRARLDVLDAPRGDER
jgi:hypothetical protein